MYLRKKWDWVVVVHAGKQRQVDLCEFQTSLVYRAGSRTARVTQRNPEGRKERKEGRKKRKREIKKENFKKISE